MSLLPITTYGAVGRLSLPTSGTRQTTTFESLPKPFDLSTKPPLTLHKISGVKGSVVFLHCTLKGGRGASKGTIKADATKEGENAESCTLG